MLEIRTLGLDGQERRFPRYRHPADRRLPRRPQGPDGQGGASRRSMPRLPAPPRPVLTSSANTGTNSYPRSLFPLPRTISASELDDIDVVLGQRIRIPSPTKLRSRFGRAQALRARRDARPVRQGRQPGEGGENGGCSTTSTSPSDANGTDDHQLHGMALGRPRGPDLHRPALCRLLGEGAGAEPEDLAPHDGGRQQDHHGGRLLERHGRRPEDDAVRPDVRDRDARERPQYHLDGQFPPPSAQMGRIRRSSRPWSSSSPS